MLKNVANIAKGLAADAVEKAGSGHPGLPVGCAEIGAVLYGKVLKQDPKAPQWPDRDRFVLSAGHGSAFLYTYLHLAGYDLSLDELKSFRQYNSKTPGHPEYGHTVGVETTTGPLGQGFANAVGMAIAEKMLATKYNTEKHKVVDHNTYTLLGDGCMMEGISSEAASLAGHLGLGKLIAIYDDNDISIGGSTDITFTESVGDRFKAYNWHVIEDVDGHDVQALEEAIKKAKEIEDKPSLIIAKTKIACGAPTKEGTADAHGAPLGEEEIKGMKKCLGLPGEEKFYISDEVKEYFSALQKELQVKREEWEETFKAWAKENPSLKQEWDQGIDLNLKENFRETIEAFEIDSPIATRSASGKVLSKIADEVPYLVGGSADLAPSNKTYLDKYGEIQKDNFDGRNFRFGVREHAMGAIVNGISLHKGLRPFCSTFLVFSDYMRGAIRVSALMKQPVVYVFTHDSVYVGEDGPTHQPIEHVESLRIIPGLKVLRPADAEETKVAWIQAMERTDGPTALILTRQNLPLLEKAEKLAAAYNGAYLVVEENKEKDLDLVLMASGSEVSLAVEVAEILQEKGKNPRVISVPDREAFVADSKAVNNLIDKSVLTVALEAGVGLGWHQLLGDNYHLVSIEDFGMSAPAEKIAEELGFVADKIAKDILEKL